MNAYKFITLIVVSALIAILLATALNSFTRVSDSALAETAPGKGGVTPPQLNAPTIATRNYLPIIFLNSATAGGAWLLSGNAGTNPASDFLGTTDNVTLTIRVSNTVAFRLVPSGANTPNVIGGYSGNSVAPGLYGATIGGGGESGSVHSIIGGNYATIGGGSANAASNAYTTVGGGGGNTASNQYATVGGGGGNTASAFAATIGGGYFNRASGERATIGGGYLSTAGGYVATVGGGAFNAANGISATIGGGSNNLANNSAATVGGGLQNTASNFYATVGGGLQNTGGGNSATIGGGYLNRANANNSTIGGGASNTASGYAAAIGGGISNTISVTGSYAFIGGGSENTAFNTYATVSGGNHNTAGYFSTVGGGLFNSANGSSTTVGGGSGNLASGDNAAIGGGLGNYAAAQYAAIGGGNSNSATGDSATVGGGFSNSASGISSTIAGGYLNVATGMVSSIGGGQGNFATQSFAAIAGGWLNTATGQYATVGGGAVNEASGYASAIPGGALNTATMSNTFAAGACAHAVHQGAFVWSDPTCPDFTSTGNNQFLVLANGGVGIGTNMPAAQLHVSSSGGDGMPQARLSQTNASEYVRLRFTNDASSPTNGYNNRWDVGSLSTTFTIYTGKYGQNALSITPGSGTDYMVMGNSARLTAGGAWTNASDQNLKANFEGVDGLAILAHVANLPIQSWNYKAEDTTVRHIGPMAQDFYAAFNVGENDTTISTVDAQGVALAAIQELDRENQELKAQNAEMKTQLASQDARLSSLEQQSPASNAFTLNTLPLWSIVGLLMLWLVRKRKS